MAPTFTTPDEIETEIARLDDADEAKKAADVDAAAAADRRRGQRRAAEYVRPAQLKEGRVGCIVWWSARDIFVDDKRLRSTLRAAEIATDCPTCSAIAGKPCVVAGADGGEPVEADAPCEARGPRLADLVREPVGPHTAMRRAMARCQSGVEDGMRWFDCGTERRDDKSWLRIALSQQADGDAAGDVLATARWVVAVADDGTLALPDDERVRALGDRGALVSLLRRFQKERSYLTAPDVAGALVDLFLARLGGFRVKAGGAVYFLAAGADAVTDAIARPFHDAGVYLRRVEVTTAAAAQLADAASESLEEEAMHLLDDCRAAKAAVVAAMADADAKGKPRLKPTLDKLRKVDDIRRRATLYAQALGAMTAEVDAAARDAEDCVRTVLAELTDGLMA